MTNFDKLARWDADYYNTLSDDECIVCLTEKQVYLLGQVIEQLTWYKTRWTGDTAGLDFDKISGDLNYRLSERMTCTSITTILNTVNDLQQTVIDLQQTINIIHNETTTEPDIYIFEPETSTVGDVHTPQALQDFGVTADNCDDAGKDAIYGAINQLVRYINQRNIDFLENINQAGNTPEQIERAISAIPIFNESPIDEIFGWVNFIATELEDEYNAIVTEALLQSVVCDLFCIAVASDCHLDFNDVYNYFAGKVSPSISLGVSTVLSLIQFAALGTMSGDAYFHYMCYFQLSLVGMGQFYLGVNSLNDYAYQTRAGLNSPDHDWSIFCLDCPPLYRLWTWDFAQGMGEFTFDIAPAGSECPGLTLGTFEGDRVKGVNCSNDMYAIGLEMTFNPLWRVRGAKIHTLRENGIANGTYDSTGFKMRPTAESDTGSTNIIAGGFRPNGVEERCDFIDAAPFYISGANQIWLHANVIFDTDPQSAIYITKVEILFEVDFAKLGSVITEDGLLCS